MVAFVLALLSSFLVGLVLASGIRLRSRVRRRLAPRSGSPRVDDQAVRAIIERGVLVTDEDEPLDLGEIEEEERRFWSSGWDEPDET
jgi:hypothetical protein